MKINVRHNFKEAQRWMNSIERKQIPFATALALNDTKDRCQDGVKTAMLRKLDRPTPFTMNAFDNSFRTRAKKRYLTAIIQVKPIQAEYLYEMFYGGTETKKHIVPGEDAKLNQYGNLPRGASKRGRTFNIVSNGTPMTLRRKGKGKNSRTEVVGIYPNRRTYRQRVNYERIVWQQFDRWFGYHWEKAFAKAMLTAR